MRLQYSHSFGSVFGLYTLQRETSGSLAAKRSAVFHQLVSRLCPPAVFPPKKQLPAATENDAVRAARVKLDGRVVAGPINKEMKLTVKPRGRYS